MPTLPELQQFLDDNGIQYFKATELVTGLIAGNEVPPKELWDNAIPVLKVLDKAREKLGRIKINSGYRCPAYNRKVGGASRSKHRLFMALDIKPLDSTLGDLQNWLLDNIPSDSWGLKRYETFIHIDCRPDKYRSL